MIKLLTFLCLWTIFNLSASASHLLPEEHQELNNLQQQASYHFQQGNREQEWLTRIEILKYRRDFEALRIAIAACALQEEFDVGQYLLKHLTRTLKNVEIKILQNYLQNMQIRADEQKQLKAFFYQEIYDSSEDDFQQDPIAPVISLRLTLADQERLNVLELLVNEYFRRGYREQEQSGLIEIAKIRQDLSSLKRSIDQCILCQDFTEGKALLENYHRNLTNLEVKLLSNQLQDAEAKYE